MGHTVGISPLVVLIGILVGAALYGLPGAFLAVPIAGVMGAYFVLYPQSRILTLVPIVFFLKVMEVPAVVFLGIWFVIQFFSSVASVGVEASGIAFWAHVAGFLAGVAWILIFRARRTEWA